MRIIGNCVYAFYLIYAVCITLGMIFVMLLCMIPFLFVPIKSRTKAAYAIFHFTFQLKLFFIGIWIEKKYQSPLAKHKKKCVYVSNHLSYLDAIVVTAAICNVFRPLGKAGIATIPLIGFLYKQYVILVDRKSIQSKKESLKEMKQTLDNGNSVLLFPEGTFYDTITQRLNEFKDGAFHLAIETKVIVQPLILQYTRERLNPKSILSLRPGKIIIHFLDPVNSHDYTLLQASDLKNKIHAQMEAYLEGLNYPRIEKNT